MATLPAAASLTDVEYGRADGISLRMDAQIPPGPGPFPAVILVHGGGWVGGSRTWNVSPLFEPLNQAGFAWFSISYRLAKDFFHFGVAVADVRQAVHHVRSHASEYNIDPARIALLGESAGGHLASLAALEEPESVAAVVALYSPNDLEYLTHTSLAVPEQFRQAMQTRGLAGLITAHLRSLSPVAHVRPDAPPFLLIHGTADTVVPYSQSTRMQAELQTAGASCDLIAVPGGGHGMRYWDHSPGQTGYRRNMIAWLKKKLAA